MEHDKKKIKVLILTNDLFVGGVQKLVIDQVAHLDRSVFDLSIVSLIQAERRGTLYDRVPEGIRVHALNFTSLKSIQGWCSLITVLRIEKPDIVKSALFFSNTVARVLQPFFGYRVVAAEHNTEAKRSYSSRLINWYLSHFCTTIVADSNTVAAFVSKTEHISEGKFTVIYNGVELAEIAQAKALYGAQKESIRAELGMSVSDKVFVNIARLSTQKNHHLMIDGFNELCKKKNGVKLIIIGDGPFRGALEGKIKEYGLINNVFLLGERTDIYRYYAIADFFLLTSVREGFCISAMNGLAFGLPLVSTRVAGVVEYLKDGKNGYFINDDKNDIGRVLDRVTSLNEVELHAFRTAAVATAANFGVDQYAAHYNKLFLKIGRSR